jgi:hypothetical protein
LQFSSGPLHPAGLFRWTLAMTKKAADLARHLADNAEAVCRYYLSNGCREGRTWRVGDVDNTPGRSLSVRLEGTGKGAAGKWTDFATGEHGDLLDLIARCCRLDAFRDVLDEARHFLALPSPDAVASMPQRPRIRIGSPDAARSLFASARPISGTIAEIYLRKRGITDVRHHGALRFHPSCYYRALDQAAREAWPALLAAVTDINGVITGVLRTWPARDGSAKAPLPTPRRAMGDLLGNGVRFGATADVMAAGEGIETILSLRLVLRDMPMVAALSASHLSALVLPSGLRRIYIARDNDAAGHRAAIKLSGRAEAASIEVLTLTPQADDFNTDLVALGRQALATSLTAQLAPDDVRRFLHFKPHVG